MYVSKVATTFLDFPDNTSNAAILFLEGCSHHCPDCQNIEEQIQNPEHSMEYNKVLQSVKDLSDRAGDRRVVISGGDPFFEKNRADTIKLIDDLQSSNYMVCVYTGYEIEEIRDFYKLQREKDSKNYCVPSWTITGKFIKELYRPAYKTDEEFRLASPNQKFYRGIISGIDSYDFKLVSRDGVLKFDYTIL